MSEQIARYEADRDAFGHMLFDHLNGSETVEIIEREDGLIEAAQGSKLYFADYPDWPAWEQEAMSYLIPGRALDLGCGPGRVELYLQSQGVEALGIDVSPLAIEVCRRRGVKQARLLSVTQVSRALGSFEDILMLGNNWGLMGNPLRARWLLRKFHTLTSPKARIIAESNDPYQTDSPYHLAYHAWNRERGRMSGQVRIRVRYKTYRSGWFDYLMVSREEMQSILEGTGWQARQFISSPGSIYVAILEKV
jgi:SAM-dependent methyltransferase